MESYETQLRAIAPELSFGYQTIRICRPEERQSMQVGYSVGMEGQSLVGGKKGDWLGHWIVIGYEEQCGDPIFIDESAPNFPVYTAMHGEGIWDPEQIAASLEGFGKALSAVTRIARGREHPVALENNPLTQSERDAALAEIPLQDQEIDLEFWENLLS
jgi:hypothetical protein